MRYIKTKYKQRKIEKRKFLQNAIKKKPIISESVDENIVMANNNIVL